MKRCVQQLGKKIQGQCVTSKKLDLFINIGLIYILISSLFKWIVELVETQCFGKPIICINNIC